MESTDQRSGYEGIRLARPIEVRGGAGDDGAGRLRLSLEEEAYLRRFLGGLTDREREVVVTVCAEGTNEGAAKKLEVTLATLRTHLMKVNQKLGTSSKTDVVRFAADRVIRGYRDGDLGRGGGPGIVR